MIQEQIRLYAQALSEGMERMSAENQMMMLAMFTAMVLDRQPEAFRSTRAMTLIDGILQAYGPSSVPAPWRQQ